MHLLCAADPRERLLELDPHAVRRPVADVLDDEEEEAAVEDDVEDHLGVAALVSHWPSLCPGLTSVANGDTMAAKERANA